MLRLLLPLPQRRRQSMPDVLPRHRELPPYLSILLPPPFHCRATSIAIYRCRGRLAVGDVSASATSYHNLARLAQL